MKSAYSFSACLVALVTLGAGCLSTPVSPSSSPTVSDVSPSSTEPVVATTTTRDAMTASSTTSSDVMIAASSTVSATSTTSTPSHSSSSASVMDSSPLAFPGVMPAAELNKRVHIKTTLGDIVIQVDPAQGPNAASNFVYLVKRGFYNGTIFHRVIPGFMIQGGDPTGTGRGGPGYQFANDPVSSSYLDGVVAMANAGPDTNGSQFFIMVADYPLPPSYSIFGKVVKGLDIVHRISEVARNGEDRPDADIKMVNVKIEE